MSALDIKIAEIKQRLPTACSIESERLCLALDLIAELPAKVAAQGPFATSAEARAVLDHEMAEIVRALDGIQ
jgi:hypothetical protein